jgi:V8-like Glu-specific endopeptidase
MWRERRTWWRWRQRRPLPARTADGVRPAGPHATDNGGSTVGCQLGLVHAAPALARAAGFVTVLTVSGCLGAGRPAPAGRPPVTTAASVPVAGPVTAATPGPGQPVPGQPFATAFTENGGLAAAARAYWTAARFGRALPWAAAAGRAHAAYPGPPPAAVTRVGALFSHDTGGDHFCTASVVHSVAHDMIVTAAHCVHGGRSATYRRDIVFVPGYRDRAAPFGIWLPARMTVATGWARSSNPALDVAFIMLRPLAGREIEDVVGADRLGIGQGFRNVVRVTGYPSTGEEAITCVNRTSRQSRYQMRFACKGYSPGTSGSPWLARFDARTGTGLIIGVIGGYQDGGDTADVSYSPYFGKRIERLYFAAGARS